MAWLSIVLIDDLFKANVIVPRACYEAIPKVSTRLRIVGDWDGQCTAMPKEES
jgi:hypothetical protein